MAEAWIGPLWDLPLSRHMTIVKATGPRRRRTIAVALALALVAGLAAGIAFGTPWDTRGAPGAVDARSSPPATTVEPPPPGGLDTTRPPPVAEAEAPLGISESTHSRRRHHRFPWVEPSTDPLPPQQPVPSAPRASVVTSLGRCCSESREGRPIDAIVLHTTESSDEPGLRDLLRLVRFFARSELGAHVADDAEGNSSRNVRDALMAYHATYWNAATLGIEQIGAASFTRSQWLRRPRQLEATAAWIAHWARQYRIPIRRCVVGGIGYNRHNRVVRGAILRRGVCSHSELDPRNRDDPGAGYPWRDVLSRARSIARSAG